MVKAYIKKIILEILSDIEKEEEAIEIEDFNRKLRQRESYIRGTGRDGEES